MMMKVCGILTVVALLQFVVATELKVPSTKLQKNQRLQYPESRRDDSVIDDYYGVKVCKLILIL